MWDGGISSRQSFPGDFWQVQHVAKMENHCLRHLKSSVLCVTLNPRNMTLKQKEEHTSSSVFTLIYFTNKIYSAHFLTKTKLLICNIWVHIFQIKFTIHIEELTTMSTMMWIRNFLIYLQLNTAFTYLLLCLILLFFSFTSNLWIEKCHSFILKWHPYLSLFQCVTFLF